MANPALGVGIGNFLQAFTSARQNEAEKQNQDKLTKLQAKLIEEQLRAGKVKLDAETKLVDLLTGTVQTPAGARRQQIELQAPEGELGTFQPKQPKSLSALLADPEGQLAALQSGHLQAKDLLPGSDRKFEKLATLEAMGLDPKSEEGKKFLMGGELGDQLDALNAQLKSLELMVEMDKFKRNAEKEGEQATLGAFAVDSLSKNSQEAVDLMMALEGTPYAVGTTFGGSARNIGSTIAAAGSAVGADTKEQKELIAKRDRLGKLFGQILNTRIDRMIQSGQIMTDAKIEQLQITSPSVDYRPEANRKLFADFLEEELVRADAAGTPILAESRQKIEKFIKEARAAGVEDVGAVVDIPAIAEMTLEQLNEVGKKWDELSNEAKEAIADRWDELNGK